MFIKLDNEVYEVTEYTHITPGNKRAIIQTKLKSFRNDNTIEERFSSSDKIEVAIIEQVPVEFLYRKGNDYVFMNQNTYEEVILSKDLLGESILYLTPNLELKVNHCDDETIGIVLPVTVDLKIVETEPALKTATITNVHKSAKLETGLTVQVPPFVGQDEIIRVDTRDGKYVERVK